MFATKRRAVVRLIFSCFVVDLSLPEKNWNIQDVSLIIRYTLPEDVFTINLS